MQTLPNIARHCQTTMVCPKHDIDFSDNIKDAKNDEISTKAQHRGCEARSLHGQPEICHDGMTLSAKSGMHNAHLRTI